MHIRFALFALGIALGLFLAMLLALEIGRRAGLRQNEKRGTAARVGVGVVDSAVYAVLALLLGFLFAGATSRFDNRRTLVAEEVSAISTAWSRIDALPAAAQPPIRERLRRYVNGLVESYSQGKMPGSPDATRERAAMLAAENDLWTQAVAACLATGGEPARMLLLPSLNELFDVVDRERLSRRMHPPGVIWLMLGLSAMAAALFAGYSMAGPARNWIYTIGVAATISVVTYVIIELEYPRLGLVRVDAFDKALLEVRETITMN